MSQFQSKTFTGEVIESCDGSFSDAQGERVKLWRIVVALNEERCRVFHFSPNPQSLFDLACKIKKGDYVEVDAEPIGKFDGTIKWRPTNLRTGGEALAEAIGDTNGRDNDE